MQQRAGLTGCPGICEGNRSQGAERFGRRAGCRRPGCAVPAPDDPTRARCPTVAGGEHGQRQQVRAVARGGWNRPGAAIPVQQRALQAHQPAIPSRQQLSEVSQALVGALTLLQALPFQCSSVPFSPAAQASEAETATTAYSQAVVGLAADCRRCRSSEKWHRCSRLPTPRWGEHEDGTQEGVGRAGGALPGAAIPMQQNAVIPAAQPSLAESIESEYRLFVVGL